MPSFHPEPPFTHGQADRTAVLLCNLGTPDEPTAPAVRRYLAQFLGDHRVVEIPKLLWMPCLLYTSPSPRDRQKSRMPSSA